jgi:hypothetical protein
MPINENFRWNPTPEERLAARQMAKEERERIIQKAIDDGATIQYTTSRIPVEDWETHIYMSSDNECTIDTTIPRTMTKCLKRGWKVNSITYFKDTNQIVGMIFSGNAKNISIGNVKQIEE